MVTRKAGTVIEDTAQDRRDSELRRPVAWQRLLNRPMQVGFDIAVLTGAFVLSYALRFDFAIPPERIHDLVAQLPIVLLFQFGALQVFGVYSFVWRYIGMAEVKAFVKAAFWSFLPLLLLRLGLPDAFLSGGFRCRSA